MALRRIVPGRLRLRFLGIFGAAVGVILLTFNETVLGPALVPLRVLTAETILRLMGALGIEAVRQASALYHPGGFAYEISRGCMGLVPAALLGVSMVAYPAAARCKLIGIIIGIPFLLALNLARLLHLFYLGVYAPQLFHLAHKVFWEVTIIAAVFFVWLAWAKWADTQEPAPSASPA